MGSRKRNRSEAIPVPEQDVPEPPGLLSKLRNSWEFASLMQYIALFGHVMKIDEDFGIEVCRLPSSRLYLCCALCRMDVISSNVTRSIGFALTCCFLRCQDLEVECLNPEPSQKLLEIGLCLLKWISSHRGLT